MGDLNDKLKKQAERKKLHTKVKEITQKLGKYVTRTMWDYFPVYSRFQIRRGNLALEYRLPDGYGTFDTYEIVFEGRTVFFKLGPNLDICPPMHAQTTIYLPNKRWEDKLNRMHRESRNAKKIDEQSD